MSWFLSVFLNLLKNIYSHLFGPMSIHLSMATLTYPMSSHLSMASATLTYPMSTVGAKIIARPKLSRGVFTDAVALKL